MLPQDKWKICLSDLYYDEREEEAVLEVVRSRWLTMGARTEAFERQVADMVGAEYAVALSSCTAGLYLLLAALEIGPGDEVLVPSLTFVATVNVVLNRGATPVFCDIVSPELPLIDPEEIRRNLSPRTRAVYTMDYAGYPCDYEAIAEAIVDYEAGRTPARMPTAHSNIHLLEDAAHGIGGMLDESQSLGTCADAGVYSFFSNKNVAVGEGGMVVTDKAYIAERVRLLRTHGLTHTTWERHQRGLLTYDVVAAGWNFRPSEIQAALGAVQIEKLQANQARRQRIVQRYQAALSKLPEVTLPFFHVTTWHQPACHVFPILLPNAELRDGVRQTLHVAGIQTSHHYPPIHLFDHYRRDVPSAQVSLPKTTEYSEREVTIPLHPNMTDEDVDWIVEEIGEGLAR